MILRNYLTEARVRASNAFNLRQLGKIYILFIATLLFASNAFAGVKYWVGGSGNWSDQSHWSAVSGGQGGESLPTIEDDVIVDQQSFNFSGQISIEEHVAIKSLKIANTQAVRFRGNPISRLIIAEKLSLADNVINEFRGEVLLLGKTANANYEYFRPGEFAGVLRNTFVKNYKQVALGVTTINIINTPQTCPESNDGSITVTPTDGVGPFAYYWTIASCPGATGTTSNSVSNVCRGTHSLVIVDSADINNPFVTAITMGPNPINPIILSAVNETCPGANDGTINAFVGGGTPPYQFSWSNGGGTSLNPTGLAPGNYALTVTDNNGCISQNIPSRTITPAPIPVIIDDVREVPVCGASGCTEDVTFTTAFAGATWDFGGATLNMCPGDVYEDTLRWISSVDNISACKTAHSHTASIPPVVTVTATEDKPVTCIGVNDGEATATAAGGTGPYTYSWIDVPGAPIAGANITGLPAGTWTVEATDVPTGCTVSTTVTITSPTPQVVTASASITTIVTCIQASNGEATAQGVGGNLPYLFNWFDAPGNPTTAVVTGLPVGTYNVEVRDQQGCVDTAQVAVVPPAVSPVTASISSSSNVICLGLPTGSATASGAGGNGPPYDYLWYDLAGNPTTQTVNNLNVGTYNVEVRDQDGCRDTATVVISAPNPPVITTTLTITPPTCTVGACDAAVSPAAAGGQIPYTYDWYSLGLGPQANGNINNLCPGVYNLAVMDANGCTDTTSAVISGPITASLQSKTDVVCGGQCTGVADVSASGGSGLYTYNWYDMTPGGASYNATGDSAYNVCAGVYNIEVTDGACFDTVTVTITEPAPVVVSLDRRVNNICSGECNGEIDVSFSGGTAPLITAFTDSAGTVPVNPNNFSLKGLCNGTYTFEATDALGCTTSNPVSITSPQTIVAFNVSSACPGDLTGNVQAVVSGGTAPYNITWIDPVPGNPKSLVQVGISPGVYRLEVIDANLCADTFTFNFVIPGPITALPTITDAQCKGNCTGSITNVVSGGTAPYTYLWYDLAGNPTTKDVANVCPGQYNLKITDALGCLDTAKALAVGELTPITINTGSTVSTCLGICDAKAWVDSSVIGGSSPYVFNWYDSPAMAATDTAFNMCAGVYHVEVREAGGCLDTAQVTITANPAVTASIINQVNNICSYDCLGAAEVSPAGGTAPYQILWTNVAGNPTTAAVNLLCNGTYNVDVTDASGCMAQAQAIISSNSTQVAFAVTNPSCGGYSNGAVVATVSGGQSPYQLTWINVPGNPTSNSLVGLSAGSYQLEVVDANNCKDTFTTIITDPYPVINAIPDFRAVSCFGNCDGKGWVTVTGGVAPYQYSWYNDPSASIQDTAYNLCAGTFFAAVLDAVGCRDTVSVDVTNPFSISLGANFKKPCFGVCDGFVTASVGANPAGYTYQWNDPALTKDSTALNLCAGTYKVIVTSPTNCVDSASVTLLENPQLTATLDTTRALCTNTTNGSATIIGSGGTLPYTYFWTGGVYSSTSPNPNDLAIGKYYVTLTDSVGCTVNDSVVITETYFVDAFAGPDKNICVGDSVDLIGTGGVTYLWNTGSSSDSIRVAPSGTTIYTLTATNGPCTDQDQVKVEVFQNPTASVISDREAMLEGMSATFTADGAGPGGKYDWNPPVDMDDPTSQTPVVNPLVSTRYYLTVTNSFGCTDTTSILIKIIESILYPDALSPNGDGINDDWPIIYIENFPDCVVEIYNRWGQLLFHSVGYANRWDGTHKGKELPVGTYYFVIDLGEGLPKYTGPITIFR